MPKIASKSRKLNQEREYIISNIDIDIETLKAIEGVSELISILEKEGLYSFYLTHLPGDGPTVISQLRPDFNQPGAYQARAVRLYDAVEECYNNIEQRVIAPSREQLRYLPYIYIENNQIKLNVPQDNVLHGNYDFEDITSKLKSAFSNS